MTRSWRGVLARAGLFLLLSLPLAAAGCDAETCADERCEEPDDPDEGAETGTPGDPRPPVPCRQACEALIGGCEPAPPTNEADLKGVLVECVDWCEEGGLTPAEAGCLVDPDSCGEAPEDCFTS